MRTASSRCRSPARPDPTRTASLDRLFPDPGPITPAEAYRSLGLVDSVHPDRPYTVANMVMSADGRGTRSGRTEGISSDTDRELFHSLRAQVDAVMVGTGTITLERYGPLAQRPEVCRRRAELGLSEVPLACTVSRSLELPVDTPLFQDAASRIVVATNTDREPPPCAAELIVERIPGDELDLVATAERLRAGHGVRTMLLEGGPTLLAAMLGVGLVDELFLSVAPLLVEGAETSILEGTAFERPAGLELLSVLEHEGFLYLRYRIR